jgi:hypothetical protein
LNSNDLGCYTARYKLAVTRYIVDYQLVRALH